MVKKNAKNFTSVLIVSDDLPDGKKNAKNFASGLIISGDLPDSEKVKSFHCDGWLSQLKKNEDFLGGLILMGGLFRSKIKGSHCDGWLFQLKIQIFFEWPNSHG